MDSNILIESEDWQRLLCHRLGFHLDRPEITERAAILQAFTHIFVSDDRSIFLKDRISTSVIKMVVCVDDKAHWLISYAFECGFDLISQRRELIIDDDNPIFTCRNTDISTCS